MFDLARVKDIAKQAGVSLSTASQILRNPSDTRYAEKTRRKVIAVSEEFQYYPNSMARALAKQKTHNVGLVAMDWLDPHYHLPLAEIGRISSSHDHNLVVTTTKSSKDWFRMVLERKVDLLISLNFWPMKPIDRQHLRQVCHKVIAIGPTPGPENIPYWGLAISWDEEASSSTMADYFLQKGHTKLAILTGDRLTSRTAGFVNKVTRSGHTPWIVLTPKSGIPARVDLLNPIAREKIIQTPSFDSDNRAALGEYQLRALLTAHPNITGVFCRNELYAFGAMRTAAELGLRIPRDISIAGHNDNSELFPSFPALTTVRTPILQAVRMGLERYFSGRMKPKMSPEDIYLPCELIEGDTVAPPRK